MPQEAAPHGIAHVRGRVCRRRPARPASLTYAAAYAAVSRPVRHSSRTSPALDLSRTPPGVRGRGRRPADHRAASRSSPYAVARRGSCQEALSPLGLGSSHTAAGPSGRSGRPTWAPGCPVAHRYAPSPRKGDVPGRPPCGELLHRGQAGPELLLAQLVRPRGRARDEVGDPQARAKDLRGLVRVQPTRRPAARVQRRPQPVAGVREVQADRAGPQRGVDAAQQDRQTGCDQVGYDPSARGLELRGRGARSGHVPSLPNPGSVAF